MKSLRDAINMLDSIKAYPGRPEQDIIDEIQDAKSDINDIADSIEVIAREAYDTLKEFNTLSLIDLDDIVKDLDEVRSSLY